MVHCVMHTLQGYCTVQYNGTVLYCDVHSNSIVLLYYNVQYSVTIVY